MKSIYTLSLLFLFSLVGFAQQWVKKTSVPASSRHHPVNFVIDGKAYYLTGMNSSNAVLKDFYEYNPTTDNWTKKSDFPGDARGFAYGASYEGKGYVGMGLTFPTSFLNDLWEYDPDNDQWTQLASMNGPGRKHPAFVAFKGKIFVGLGDDGSANFRDWYVYTIATNTWQQGPSLPAIARHHPYYFHAGEYVYAGFGHSTLGIEKDWWRYDVENDSWTAMKDFPGEARVAGTQFSYNDNGYILGGDGSDHNNLDTGEFYEYDDENDSWKELPAAPGQGRWAPGSFVIDGVAYLTSGETHTGTLYNDLWAFDLNQFVSTQEIEKDKLEFNIYPNPANDVINLPSVVMQKEIASTVIYDFSGKKISIPIVVVGNSSINVSSLPPQLYLLEVRTTDGNVFRSRFVKE